MKRGIIKYFIILLVIFFGPTLWALSFEDFLMGPRMILFTVYYTSECALVILFFIWLYRKIVKIERDNNQYFSNVSHELKTPIANIMNHSAMIEMMVKKYSDPALTKAVVNVKNQAEHMKVLVEKLLKISRLEEGKRVLELQSVSARELIDDTLEFLAEQIKTAKSKVNITITLANESEEQDFTFQTDKLLLTEVLTNLVSNAIKYGDGNIDISAVRSAATSAMSRNVKISVKNGGTPISKANQKKIFDRFYRVDRSHNRETGGHGIGLSLSAQIVKLLGGKLTVQSNVKDGTSFTVSI